MSVVSNQVYLRGFRWQMNSSFIGINVWLLSRHDLGAYKRDFLSGSLPWPCHQIQFVWAGNGVLPNKHYSLGDICIKYRGEFGIVLLRRRCRWSMTCLTRSVSFTPQANKTKPLSFNALQIMTLDITIHEGTVDIYGHPVHSYLGGRMWRHYYQAGYALPLAESTIIWGAVLRHRVHINSTHFPVERLTSKHQGDQIAVGGRIVPNLHLPGSS